MSLGATDELALGVLRMYTETFDAGWDLHSFFELLAGDNPERREAVLDTVDSLTG